MKRLRYLSLFIILAATFAIAGFNFEDLSFEENTQEYVLLLIAILLGIVYLVNRTVLSKK